MGDFYVDTHKHASRYDASNKNELVVDEENDVHLETNEVLEDVVAHESDDDLDFKKNLL